MKYYITSILTLFLSLSTQAQVGIKTETPERTVDVNGNLRVTTLQDKKDDKTYDNIVIANSAGDIDKQHKSSITQSPKQQVEIVRNIYYSDNGGHPDKTVVCGNYVFAFTTDNHPVMKIAKQPDRELKLQFGLRRLERRYNLTGGHSANTGDGDYYYSNVEKTFTTSNWNTFQKVFDYTQTYSDPAHASGINYTQKHMINNDLLRLHIIDPLSGNFYRINFTRMVNRKEDTGGQANYLENKQNSGLRIIICERYYNTAN